MGKYILIFARGSGSVWVHLSTILRVQVWFRFTEVKFCWFRFGSGSPKWNGSFGFTVRVQVRFDTLVKIEILYHIHALVRLMMEPFIVLNYWYTSTFKNRLLLGSYSGLGSHFKARYHIFIHVFSCIHRPGCRKHKDLVKENFLLGYLSSLKACLLCTVTCLVKWFSTFYSTCTTFDRQKQHFYLTIVSDYFLHLCKRQHIW